VKAPFVLLRRRIVRPWKNFKKYNFSCAWYCSCTGEVEV